MLPRRLRDRIGQPRGRAPSLPRRAVTYALAGLVGYLSIPPVQNLLAAHQAMNTSFDRLHLVNTYGAFGRSASGAGNAPQQLRRRTGSL